MSHQRLMHKGMILLLLAGLLWSSLANVPATQAARTNVHINQAGYLPNAPKRAAIANSSTTPLSWQLKNGSGTTVASGSTSVLGYDASSGDNVHSADFSAYTTPGTNYTLTVGGVTSNPFDISGAIYSRLKYDALAYFYHNRSGIAITLPYAGRADLVRPAGHVGVAPNQGDTSVPCAPGIGCSYSLDVRGGWYDAGDHGKYVVNGGISVWTMLNQYERARHFGSTTPFADGQMNIPEQANGVPDILDEARWQMEFMLRMQVPASTGSALAGMVHHKMHDASWTGIPTRPDQDSQPRQLRPVSTAATLNLAATAAQCARIWRTIDATFAAKCQSAAETAWSAAQARPTLYASDGDGTGGGPYGDSDVSDEFYWAAAELYITTGNATYRSYLTSSRHYRSVSLPSWQETQALGTISLAVVPNNFSSADIGSLRTGIVGSANATLATINAQGYRVPIATYDWGSNSAVTNAMIMLGLANDFSSDSKYLYGMLDGMDYLLGRNALDQSYITGYGENAVQNPHHRFWAFQSNSAYPRPPAGALSGGPNPAIQDPLAAAALAGCKPQRCWMDDIGSWSTNEITINWNAPLAWVAAYIDEKSGGTPPPPTATPVTPTPTTIPGSCGSANVAQGRPATASSSESASYAAGQAVDGVATTRWSSAFSDPQWIQVDLGAVQTVCRVRLSWEAAYGSTYQIQVSPDGVSWTTIKSVSGENGGIDDHPNLSAAARYVRIVATQRATPYGYSLFEFEIFTSTGNGTPTATSVPPTATSVPPSDTRVLDSFESGSLSAWSVFKDPSSSVTPLIVSPGQLGQNALRVSYSISSYGGIQQLFSASQGWNLYQGIRFGFNGANTGATFRLEVLDNSSSAGNNPDAAERWVYTFTDNVAGWRTIIVPWSAFSRRSDWQPTGAPNDGFGRTQIWGFSFAPSPASGSSGSSTFQLDQIELYGGTSTTPTPITPSPTPLACGSANVAQGRPATASSSESASYAAGQAVDGVVTTRWSSAFSDPQWIQVDLGAAQTICRVRLSWEAAYGSAYQIRVSPDGVSWTTLKSVSGENGGIDDHPNLSATARYVRIVGTQRATPYGYSLFEFEVYRR
ncbi:MAG: glycoside hydrolase family 9 protein [Herpetosiphonaceae bacterium]|nr:glycoside hydrolase family 9 protein [Herpetosiphonaceae bacterium]